MNNSEQYIFFELCNGTIIGFSQANVDKFYNCLGLYIRNDAGKLEEINSDSESDYFLKSDIEGGVVLELDGSPVKLEDFGEVNIVYKVQVGGHIDWFEGCLLNDVITDLKQEENKLWVNAKGEAYIDISTPLNYSIVLKKNQK